MTIKHQILEIFLNRVLLNAELRTPPCAHAVVMFVHGDESSRQSRCNKLVAEHLNDWGIATLLVDLLTKHEDDNYENRGNLRLLSERLTDVTNWLASQPSIGTLPVGYFGANTGAEAAIGAAAILGERVSAVVCRGGVPSSATGDLEIIRAPTLLIVGGKDRETLVLDREVYKRLNAIHELSIIPEAGHLFDGPGELETVASLSAAWFTKYLRPNQKPLAKVV